MNPRATQSANKQNKYLWDQCILPPKTFSGVDQAPNQRLFFPLSGPFSSIVRSFLVVHSTSDPLVERSFN